MQSVAEMPTPTLLRVSNNKCNAADINQFSNALHVTTGNFETGDFFLACQTQASGNIISNWIVTLNHQNAPASVTLTTTSSLNLQATYPKSGNLAPTGFQLYAAAAGANNNTNAAGTWSASF